MIIADNTLEDLVPYLIRRVFRILPVYDLALIVTVVLALVSARLHLGDARSDQLRGMLLPSIFFSRELASAPTLFKPAWTVGIEEKFYLVWPLVLLLFCRFDLRIAVAIGIVLVFLYFNNPFFIRGYGGIAFGAIAALVYRRTGFSINSYVAIALVAIAYWVTLQGDHLIWNLGISFSGAVLVCSLYARPSLIKTALGTKWLAHLGQLTYTIYMFHILVLFAVKIVLGRLHLDAWYVVFILGYPCCVLFAEIIHQTFEKPLIAYGRGVAARHRAKSEAKNSA